jgi:hypothetical protein
MARARNSDGQFRSKSGNTLVRNIEKQYNVDFNVRSDMKLSTYLKKSGQPSLSKVLEKVDQRLKK